MSWLQDISDRDEITLEEAAYYAVIAGVALDVSDYMDLGKEGRAALLAAHTMVHAGELEAEGRDLDAAKALAHVDGGRSAARLMARAAGEGVARALKAAKDGDHG